MNCVKMFSESDFHPNTKCGVCGSTNLEELSFFCEPGVYHIQCNNCHAVTFNKVLNPEHIAAIYEEYDYQQGAKDSGQEGDYTFSSAERFGVHLLKLFGKDGIRKNLSILDFGGGDGSLAYVLAEKLIDCSLVERVFITVIDYNENLRRSNRDSITLCKAPPPPSLPPQGALSQFPPESFDIIIASAVMEHIELPGVVFRNLFSLLKTNGLIYFRVPYIYPLFSLLRKVGISIEVFWPQHIWDMGKLFWESLPQVLSLEPSIQLSIVKSRPSIVSYSFRRQFFHAAGAYLLKAPCYLFPKWPFVGGWEVVYKKR